MSIPKLSAAQLVEMAYRGAEDGHPDDWHRQMTRSARVVELMKEAADKARNNLTYDHRAIRPTDH